MKDTRFIELVNLYIDRQISPDEAAELELEIQSNARRREVYHDYCRMHRATKLVYESFRAQAGEDSSRANYQPGSIARIQARARQRRARWMYAAGGLAAAACVAFVFMVGRGPSPVAAAPEMLASAPASARVESVARVAAKPDVASVAVAEPTAAQDYRAMLTSLREQHERVLDLGVQPGRLSLFDDGVFEERSNPASRTLQTIQPRRARGNAEFTAFQFQR